MFAVPMTRKDSLATLFDGSIVSEKSLSSEYLSLEERVTYRRRVMLFTKNEQGVCFFPTWDFNGPDLSYFGEWKPAAACPWHVDGRKLVADAKDRVLQMVEAAKARGHKRLLVYEGVPHTLTLNRGWKLQSMPWLAFYAGVRKAAEVTDMEIVAVSEHNPYEGIASCVPWITKVEPQQGDVSCHPCDVFSSFLYDPKLVRILESLLGNVSNLFTWMPLFAHTSRFHTQYRNAHWTQFLRS